MFTEKAHVVHFFVSAILISTSESLTSTCEKYQALLNNYTLAAKGLVEPGSDMGPLFKASFKQKNESILWFGKHNCCSGQQLDPGLADPGSDKGCITQAIIQAEKFIILRAFYDLGTIIAALVSSSTLGLWTQALTQGALMRRVRKETMKTARKGEAEGRGRRARKKMVRRGRGDSKIKINGNSCNKKTATKRGPISNRHTL